MLLQFREYIGSFLRVEVEMRDSHSLQDSGCVAVLYFNVTNSAPSHEYYPEIVYEEVKLKVGRHPKWHIETFENLAAGQSITYDYPCTAEEIAGIQWTVEGKISPSALLHFRRRPVDIRGNQQLSVKAYFDYLAGMKVFQRLEGILKDLGAPDDLLTLCEMKAEEIALKDIAEEISNVAQQIEGFLEFLDMGKYRSNIVKHSKMVRDQLEKTGREVEGLMQKMKDCKVDDFEKARDNVLAGLAKRMNKMDKSSKSLAKKVGVG